MDEFYKFKEIRKNNKWIGIVLGALVLSLIVIIGVYIGGEKIVPTDNIQTNILGPEDAAMVRFVAQFVIFPTSEVPEIVEVNQENSAELLELFQSDVEIGDKELIYQSSKILVLYRPADDRVVWVIPME